MVLSLLDELKANPQTARSPSLPNIFFPSRYAPTGTPSGLSTSIRHDLDPSPSALLAHFPQLPGESVAVADADAEKKIERKNESTPTPTPTPAASRYVNDTTTPHLTPQTSLDSFPSSGETNTLSSAASATSDSFLDDDVRSDEGCSRFLLISNIPRATPQDSLKPCFLKALSSSVPPPPFTFPAIAAVIRSPAEEKIRGVYVKQLASLGIIVLAFYDKRDAVSCHRALKDGYNVFGTDDEQKQTLDSSFISAEELVDTYGKSEFIDETNGKFFLAATFASQNHDGFDPAHLRSFLLTFGSLSHFSADGSNESDTPTKIFLVEYYDLRDAAAAYVALDGKLCFGATLRAYHPSGVGTGALPATEPSFTEIREERLPFKEDRYHHYYHPSPYPLGPRPLSESPPSLSPLGTGYYDTPPPGASCVYCPSKPESGIGAGCFSPAPGSFYPVPYFPGGGGDSYPFWGGGIDGGVQRLSALPAAGFCRVGVTHALEGPLAARTNRFGGGGGRDGTQPLPCPGTNGNANGNERPRVSTIRHRLPSSNSIHDRLSSPTSPSAHPNSNAIRKDVRDEDENTHAVLSDRNQLNLARIRDGQDTRTTVMIKNIPNKMSSDDLLGFIDAVQPRRVDFLYLRMDFVNECNVGYAFVNFITIEDLLRFADERLGVKWNMFQSEKILQMSYANYQGKEALVEKFKNSCIMDEREAWRPKIFHSSGPEQGRPEPFPKPTHLRRKERSSFNRNTLFPPHGGGGGGANGYHQTRESKLFASGEYNHAPPRRNFGSRSVVSQFGAHSSSYSKEGEDGSARRFAGVQQYNPRMASYGPRDQGGPVGGNAFAVLDEEVEEEEGRRRGLGFGSRR